MDSLEKVFEVVTGERKYQDRKWGSIENGRTQSIPGWLLVLRKELDEAEEAWCKKSNHEALVELSQVVAVGVACLQEHGAVNRFTNASHVIEIMLNPLIDSK